VVKWTANGVAISIAAYHQKYPTIVSDGSGGAIISWDDYRSGLGIYSDIYAQRINAAGAAQWTTDGVAISTETDFQDKPTIVSDGSGGVIITWRDARSGTFDIYAQRINSAGAVQWTTNGVAISIAGNSQSLPMIVSDGVGGAIITWEDYRTGIFDIYAQNIDRYAYLGYNAPNLTAIRDVSGDQGGQITVAWDRSYFDAYPNQVITYYSVWRGINLTETNEKLFVITPEKMTMNFAGKAHRTINGTNWEWIANVPAHYVSSYSFTSPTTSDSASGGIPYFKFFVSAQTDSLFVFWDSNVDSGYSVDNLSPHAAQSITAQVVGTTVNVSWQPYSGDPDVKDYEIHRSITDGFIPLPETKIGIATEPWLVDNAPIAGVNNYYRVVAVDIHDNKGEPSTQAVAAVAVATQYSVNNKWNLVSVPLTVNDYTKTILYPTAVSEAVAYQEGYASQATLQNGVGYWMKFNGAQQIMLTGLFRTSETISVTEGWNIIGSISSAVDASSITSNPPGLVTSQFFGYDHGYINSSTIEPGKGYWVKVSESGTLTLSSLVNSHLSFGNIKIIPLDELPPPSPEGDGNGSESSNMKPETFSLSQNFPNPFNLSTVFSFRFTVAG